MFVSGRMLSQMCVSSMYLSGWLCSHVRIRDLLAIGGWMLYDMMPFAEQFYPDSLSLLKSDQKFYDNARLVQKTHPTNKLPAWPGDFVHEMMNWFVRSEFDGEHKVWQGENVVVVPDKLVYSCKLKSDTKAREVFSKSTCGEKIFFFEKAVLPVLPKLMNCFEKI